MMMICQSLYCDAVVQWTVTDVKYGEDSVSPARVHNIYV